MVWNLLAMVMTGSRMRCVPKAVKTPANILPGMVAGRTSPYPTVVMDCMDHQAASSRVFICPLCSIINMTQLKKSTVRENVSMNNFISDMNHNVSQLDSEFHRVMSV